MRTLLLHPQDTPHGGPWRNMRWQRVIDLGFAGPATYQRWAELFGCPVEQFGFPASDEHAVREAFSIGLRVVSDRYGIDWWDTISTLYIQELYRLSALRRLAAEVRSNDELFCSRRDFHSAALEIWLLRQVLPLSSTGGLRRALRRGWDKLCRLSFPQIRQIAYDNFDPEHRVRAVFRRSRARCTRDVVLLPSAYLNVTRSAVAYAQSVPERDFLLVVARESARLADLPRHVLQSDFAAYAGTALDRDEHSHLCNEWHKLRRQLQEHCLWRVLLAEGILDDFPCRLQRWLAIRNAWLQVFDSEPICSVLSCDDANPYSLIPGLLARARGIPFAASHHGALDGHKLVKRPRADVLLAKGEMESNYLQQACDIPGERVRIAAPRRSTSGLKQREQSAIVFFSEDYEVSGARAAEFYQELLPPLSRLAESQRKELVIKLHPAESLRHRRRIVNQVLTPAHRTRVHIIHGALTRELLQQAWCAITVISSAALDCAAQGVPVFLCGWLENWPYRYLAQFSKFGVGARLTSSEELNEIPSLLKNFQLCDRSKLWESAPAGRISEILSGHYAQLGAAV